jgi:isopentenyl-diphosphate delta-isomerase
VFNDVGSEHELCSVFVGNVNGRPLPDFNPTEIADTAWVSVTAVDEWLDDHNIQTTPWFATEWQRIKDDFSGQITAPV